MDQKVWRIYSSDEIQKLITILGQPVSNWNEFLRGLIVGEGCFNIGLRNSKNYKFNVRSQPSFQMKMAEKSNIIPILQSKTGLGNVCEERRSKKNHSDQENWRITSSGELQQLITMIENQPDSLFWETDKGEVFNEWKRAIELKEENGTSDPDSVKEIIDISKNLNPGNAGRSAEDWKAIVDEAAEERRQKNSLSSL